MTDPTNHKSDAALYDRYLSALGIHPDSPNLSALTDHLAKQMARVPFENISKLYYLKRLGLKGIPTLRQYVQGIEEYHFGGTCYSNNYHFGELLRHLGFAVRLCGAAMSVPDCHIVNIVTLDKSEYLVDVGYGSPLTYPIPLDSGTDQVVEFDNDRYVLKPKDSQGKTRLEFIRNGELKHGYLVDPHERPIEHFNSVIESSYRPSATFMNALVVARYERDTGTVVHNFSVIETEGGRTASRVLSGKEYLSSEIEILFGIPHSITDEVLRMIGPFVDAWS